MKSILTYTGEYHGVIGKMKKETRATALLMLIMKTTPLSLIGMLLLAQSLLATSTIRFSARSYTVSEAAGEAELPVIRSDDVQNMVSVQFFSQALTAVAGEDYVEVSGTLTFAAGETNQTIVIPILNDGLLHSPGRFQVFLTNTTGDVVLGSPSIATFTLLDNETLPKLEHSAYEAQEDEGSVQIGIVRGGEGEEAVAIDYATADGNAHAEEDYQPMSGTLTFAAGENVQLLTIPILNDGLKEGLEVFRLYLTNATSGGLSGAVQFATISIRDNDPGVQFTRNAVSANEQDGVVSLTVTRGNDGLLEPFTVDYATTNGTAIAGDDYTETKGTLAFAAGEMTRSFTVSILRNIVAKPDRQFQVALSNPTGGVTLGPAADVRVTVCDKREMLPHRFDGVQIEPDGTVTLLLGGGFTPGLGVVNRFEHYLDIYPVDVSTNMVDWLPLAWVVRTNTDTRLLTVTDAHANGSASRFYRVPTNNFPTPSAAPTGPYAVGRTDRFVTDPNRRNRNRISTNTSFGITVWYPAERQAGETPRPYFEEAHAPAHNLGRWPEFKDRATSFRSHSVQNARFAHGAGMCPVVLFSHGFGLDRQDCVDKTENLASHGYVTVAVDHYDSSSTVLPDGRYIATSGWSVTDEGHQDRVQDLVAVLGELELWNQQDSLLAGRLDVERLAAVGVSFGGRVAPAFCRIEPRCLAAISLDGNASPGALTKPTLTMNRNGNGHADLFNGTASPAYWLQIDSTEHYSFPASSWWLLGGETTSAREVSRIINAFALWFLNKHVRGSSDPMPALSDYPRVINFTEK
jgi:pimeloyl-ACP methyl ester carboxylesterase